MRSDYQQLLRDYGFESIPEAEETTAAFSYEIGDALFGEASPFDEKGSDIQRLPNHLDAMLQCSLRVLPGKTILDGVAYVMAQWYSLLCYQTPLFETIERKSSVFGTELRIFTMIKGTGCSFLFTITDQAAEKASDDFIDGYAGVDNTETVVAGIERLNEYQRKQEKKR